MADAHILEAETRDRAGKSAARAARKEGKVPAIVYGNKQDNISVTLSLHALRKELNKGSFQSRVFDMKLGDKSLRVLPREIQWHPVTDMPEHVDFLSVTEGTTIDVMVPVIFHNQEKSPGLKRGGVLNVVRHKVGVSCAPDAIPEKLEVDLTGLSIGDAVHASHITLPENVTFTISDRDFTVATIAGRLRKEEDTVAAAPVEGGEAAEGEEAEGGDEAAAEEGDS